MANDIVIGATLRANINVIKRTTAAFETISARLATGKIVNSAIDNPQNFFAAKALDNRAADFNRRLDQIGQSISLIREAAIGAESIERLLDQSEAIVLDSLEKNLAGEVDEALIEVEIDNSPPALSSQIIDAGADIYYRLNDAGGPADTGVAGANNVANYQAGASSGFPALYNNGVSASTNFDGVNDRVQVTNNNLINVGGRPEKTVELVFNADDVSGRQVLYEEGGGTHALSIYIDNGTIYTIGRAQGIWGPPTLINAPVVAGETYHVGFTFSRGNNEFKGFLNGVQMGPTATVGNADFPSHTGGIGIGYKNGNTWFHDGAAGGGSGNYFDGRISDVAIYNRALTDSEMLSHGTSLNATTSIRIENKEYNSIRSQIDQLVIDAQYRGINLLNGESTRVNFNENGSTGLDIEGQTFTTDGLALLDLEFDSEDNMRALLDAIADARSKVRSFGQTLQNQLTVLQTREDFTQKLINNHSAGGDDLTVADQNEEGAKMLALGTRLSMATTALALGSQNQQSIGNLIASGIQA